MAPIVILVLVGLAPLSLAVFGVAIARAIDWLRELRRHGRVLSDLGPPVAPFGAAKHAVVTIDGKLVADAIAAADGDHNHDLISFHPYGTSFLDEVNVYAITHSNAPKGFAVELDGGAGRVVLDGPVQVLRGAIETEHTAPLEQAIVLNAEPLARAKVKKRVGQFRIVKPGDRVRARGAVEPAPDDDALYRERSNVLRMTAGPTDDIGEPKIVLAATTTTSRRRMQSRRGVIAMLGASAAIGGMFAIAAQRADLLSRVPHATAPKTSSSPSVAPPPPACRAQLLAKLSKYEIDSATQSCNDAYAQAMAAYASGDFGAASKAFTEAALKDPNLVPTLTEVEAHLFAHSFDEAANVVRRMNAQFYPGPSTAEKRHLECILEVIAKRASQPVEQIDKTPRFVKVCSTRPFLKLARQLDSNGGYRGEDDWPRPTYQQDTRYDAVGETYSAVILPRARLTARPVAIEKDLIDRLIFEGRAPSMPFGNLELHHAYEADDLYVIVTTWVAELTLFYAYAGFPDRSKRYWGVLDRVADVLGADKSFHHRDFEGAAESPMEKKFIEDERTLLTFVMAIAGAAALYSGEDQAVRMKRYTSMGEPYSSNASRQMSRLVLPKSVWEDPVVDRDWPEHKALFDAALHGDVEAVVRLLTEQHSNGRTTLPRAVPQLGTATDRTPLVRWFHSDAYPPACLTCGASTFLGDISDRREVAKVLGSDTNSERDRLLPIAERFMNALTDGVIGFELDELEMFFASKKK